MKARFSISDKEVPYSTENMAILAASILVSILQKESADHISIKTEDAEYVFSRVSHD